MIIHYWVFNHAFEFQDSVYHDYHDFTMLSVNISNVAIITIINADYRCNIHSVSKSEAINLLINNKQCVNMQLNYFSE